MSDIQFRADLVALDADRATFSSDLVEASVPADEWIKSGRPTRVLIVLPHRSSDATETDTYGLLFSKVGTR